FSCRKESVYCWDHIAKGLATGVGVTVILNLIQDLGSSTTESDSPAGRGTIFNRYD
ncbi:uncharacterized protein METZ01_LOCUS360122, partial [marine metagenome]